MYLLMNRFNNHLYWSGTRWTNRANAKKYSYPPTGLLKDGEIVVIQ